MWYDALIFYIYFSWCSFVELHCSVITWNYPFSGWNWSSVCQIKPYIHEWKKCNNGGFWIKHIQYEFEAYAYCFPFSFSCRILPDPHISASVLESPIFIMISVIWLLWGIPLIDLIFHKCWITFNLMLRSEERDVLLPSPARRLWIITFLYRTPQNEDLVYILQFPIQVGYHQDKTQ